MARAETVVDVGCGTGWSFPSLTALGATVIGIEVCPEMRARAEARAARLGGAVRVDSRAYGTHADFGGGSDVVVFSYSLSMIPPYEHVIERARDDLRPSGRVGVVDFLDAMRPFPARALAASHVHLGPERLDALRRVFPAHVVEVHAAGLWRYFVFVGRMRG